MKGENEAPRSGPRRAPGGSVQKEQEMVCNTNFDDLFRTSAAKSFKRIRLRCCLRRSQSILDFKSLAQALNRESSPVLRRSTGNANLVL